MKTVQQPNTASLYITSEKYWIVYATIDTHSQMIFYWDHSQNKQRRPPKCRITKTEINDAHISRLDDEGFTVEIQGQIYTLNWIPNSEEKRNCIVKRANLTGTRPNRPKVSAVDPW